MNNQGSLIVFVGLLLFCGLAAVTVAFATPSIQATLMAQAKTALADRNLTFATVDADGRDLVVTGEAPNLLMREEAIQVVAMTWGNRVVLDRMTVAATPPLPPTAPPAPEVSAATRALIDCQQAVDTLLRNERFDFEPGGARLRPNSTGLLDRLADELTECPHARFEIEGHTDAGGRESVNRSLSKQRAEAVLRALTVRGVSERRMLAIGYGSRQPIASNEDSAGRAKNRRIELRVLRKD